MFESIKARYKSFKEQRFLKRHGCKTWKEYHLMHDPDYNSRATRVKDIYHGYSHVYCFENREHHAYTLLYDWGPGGIRYGYNDIIEWCEENLKDKFRLDGHRVHTQTGIGLNGDHTKDWFINEIGGGDYIFAAFKDPKDYTLFLLRWS